MEGSSGNHPADRHTTAEVLFIDDALSQLKARLGFTSISLAGFSSGGTLAANLLSRRSDIRCAVLDSAPLDLSEFNRGRDGTIGFRALVGSDLADPMQSVRQMRSPAMIWVVGDPRDRKVPASTWLNWAAAARHGGASVVVAHIASRATDAANPRHAYHRETSLTLRIASACATGRRMEASRTTFRSRVAEPAGLNIGATSEALDGTAQSATIARAQAQAVHPTGAGELLSDTEDARSADPNPVAVDASGAEALGADVVVNSSTNVEEARQ
jgi:pimeloyl-ACP methyl ester carboxylesterase